MGWGAPWEGDTTSEVIYTVSENTSFAGRKVQSALEWTETALIWAGLVDGNGPISGQEYFFPFSGLS